MTGQDRQALFNTLADRWTYETGVYSNPRKIVDNDAFRAIVEMGQEALPFIFQKLAHEERGAWWLPLERITGTRLNSGVSQVEGAPSWVSTHVPTLKQAWLEWGIEHGHHQRPEEPQDQEAIT